jgi:ankyrin repeat protein
MPTPLFDRGSVLKRNGSTILHDSIRGGLPFARVENITREVEFEQARQPDLTLDDIKNAKGETALHAAADADRGDVVDLLVNRGASLEARDIKGATPLHHAVERGSLDAMVALADRGADVNAVNEKGMTPLHYAASKGDAETMRELIDRGANVNAQDKDGRTPLHYVAKCAQTSDQIEACVNALYEAGADLTIEDSKSGLLSFGRDASIAGAFDRHGQVSIADALRDAIARGDSVAREEEPAREEEIKREVSGASTVAIDPAIEVGSPGAEVGAVDSGGITPELQAAAIEAARGAQEIGIKRHDHDVGDEVSPAVGGGVGQEADKGMGQSR